jgi:transcriptional regulator, XRE family
MELPTPDDLRERRDGLDLTQSELADMADVSQPLIARIRAVTSTRGCRRSGVSSTPWRRPRVACYVRET